MYILKPDEETRIDAALGRIDAGEWVEHADVRKETREWLLQIEQGVKNENLSRHIIHQLSGCPSSAG